MTTQLVHEAVGYNELLAGIASSRDLDDSHKSILRLLVFQFFRSNERLAEYADSELLKLYQDYNNDDDPVEVEVLLSRGDPSPPDFPIGVGNTVSILNCSHDRSTRKYHGPISLRCVEASTPDNAGGTGKEAPNEGTLVAVSSPS